MFSILKRSKKLVLNCYTSSINVYETAKPDFSSNFLPEWWKELPQYYYDESEKAVESNNDFFPTPTMKVCDGIVKFYSKGIIIPLWSDLMVEIGGMGSDYLRWQFADKISEATQHNMGQLGNYLDEKEYCHLKLISPWAIHCDEESELIWTDPCWNTLKQYHYKILPGIISYKYVSSSHINMLFNREHMNKRIMIEHGTPMAHLIPVTDRKIELKHHLVSRDEWISIRNRYPTEKFYKSFYYRKKLLRKQEAEKSKCPFSKLIKR
jgi:hypothetical protein